MLGFHLTGKNNLHISVVGGVSRCVALSQKIPEGVLSEIWKLRLLKKGSGNAIDRTQHCYSESCFQY